METFLEGTMQSVSQAFSDVMRLVGLSDEPTTPTTTTPKERLRKHFGATMKSETVPLLNDFETYGKSLPVRMNGDTQLFEKLGEFPFWASQDEIDTMAAQLETTKARIRSLVKYLAAPPASGKTSSVLVGFLASAERCTEKSLTHYFYLAFANNGFNNFCFRQADLSDDVEVAEAQGTAFIFECLKLLLNANLGEHVVSIPRPPQKGETFATMRQFLDNKLPAGIILLHLDEHRNMCNVLAKKDQSAAFRRGALSTLAAVPRVRVIATYTDLPVEIHGDASSGVCREPVALPTPDVDEIMRTVDELNFPKHHDPTEFDGDNPRLWATLRFRLGVKLRHELMSLHIHRRGDRADDIQPFLDAFAAAVKEPETTKALEKCIKVSEPKFDMTTRRTKNATRLLLGVPEDEVDTFEGRIADLIVVSYDSRRLVTSSLTKLLTMIDPNCTVYMYGRSQLLKVLTSSPDMLSGTPLEACFSWVLSCQSAVNGFLQFTNDSAVFTIQCNLLKSGRLFPTTNNTASYNFSNLMDNTMYFVKEEDQGEVSHALADIFFKTKDNDVVLVDIYGGHSDGSVNNKANRLQGWISREQPKQAPAPWKLHGVVLAPFAKTQGTIAGPPTPNVTVARGTEARSLLGGLAQVCRWLESR